MQAETVKECSLSKTRYFKLIKSDVIEGYEVELDFGGGDSQGHDKVIIKGKAENCERAKKKLDRIGEKLKSETVSVEITADFCKCLKKIEEQEIIDKLQQKNVKAGWDIGQDSLTVEYAEKMAMNDTVEILRSLILETRYPIARSFSNAEIRALLLKEFEQLKARFSGAVITYSDEHCKLLITAPATVSGAIHTELSEFLSNAVEKDVTYTFKDRVQMSLIEKNMKKFLTEYPHFKYITFDHEANKCHFPPENAKEIRTGLSSVLCKVESTSQPVPPGPFAIYVQADEGQRDLKDVEELTGTKIEVKKEENTTTGVDKNVHLKKILISQQSLLSSEVRQTKRNNNNNNNYYYYYYYYYYHNYQ